MAATQACFLLAMVVSHASLVSGEQDVSCSASSPDNKCDNLPVDETNLLQTAVKARYHQNKPKVKRSYAHGPFPSRPFLEYFQHWSQGSVANELAKKVVEVPHVGQQLMEMSAHGEERTEVTVARMTELALAYQAQNCPSSPSLFNSGLQHGVLHNASSDEVQHILLRSSNRRLQYLAESRGRLLAADPHLCPKRTLAFVQGYGVDDMNPEMTIDLDEPSGTETSLEPKKDPLVLDCKKLVERTVLENCQKSYKVGVFSAVVKVIDGFMVEMTASIVGPENKTTYHDLQCAFETEAGNDDAELLQIGPLEEEKEGYVATLLMEEDICAADQTSDISKEEAESIDFLQQHSLGLLSRYKGYEHVHDKFPMITSLLSTKAAPTEYDMRDKFSACFPDSGKEVVRDQGSCGSCWAFAGATSIMTNLCASASGSALKDANDRFEISVQQLMSCNAQEDGCDGGHMAAIESGVKTAKGLVKERDSSYMCGHGDATKHFEEASGDDACKSAPWGSTCKPELVNDAWKFGFPIRVSGEPNMCFILATGNTLWVGFDVYANFKGDKDDIYSETSGGKRGGHAVVLVGYGVLNGVKYWTMQNSWGPSWADGGYYKVIRGNNIAGIEDEAIFIRTWVAGEDEPPCWEPEKCTAVTMGDGSSPTCADVKDWGWCEKYAHWGTKEGCPVSCGLCTGSTPGLPGGSPSASPPAPPPPPAPPTTTTTTTPPADKSACITDHTSLFGGMYECVAQNTCAETVRFKCPNLPCAHDFSPGGYNLFSCNNQYQTQICTGECKVWVP